MNQIDSLLKEIKRIHFVGIGGSGMCPLAEILHKEGYLLTGSDNNETDTLTRIKNMGIPVFMGHGKENVTGAQMVVYTAAVMADNPELVSAKEQNIPLVERSVLLGAISRRYSNTVAISGTHGKTTVTSMVTQILLKAELDPSAVIGGKLPLINANGRAGKSDTFVCEACEFVDTFLQITPAVSVILNIDADHLDYFGTLENIIKSFKKFVAQTSKTVIVNGDDSNSMKAVEDCKLTVITFGFEKSNDYTAENISVKKGDRHEFDLCFKGSVLTRIQLNVPGKHNVSNALAAAAAAINAGAKPIDVKTGLETFGGAGRRFEILKELNGITIADDYAHHPKELEVILNSAMKMGYNRVWAVFQPFTYSRTSILFDDFVRVLKIPDKCVMSEIMGAREHNTYSIYTKDLADKIEGSVWFNTFDEIAEYVVNNAKQGDLILTLGCGDIYKAAKIMIKMLGN